MPSNELAFNAWATNCPSSSNTLLALVLDEPTLGETKIFDPSSTLPIPHITLLHGFVELSSDESRLLATQTVANAVKRTLPAPSPSGSNCYLPFNASSLSAFEHRASSTLVCLPDVDSEQGIWLRRLYQTLRESFCQCHEQESRFHRGWMPHCTYRQPRRWLFVLALLTIIFCSYSEPGYFWHDRSCSIKDPGTDFKWKVA